MKNTLIELLHLVAGLVGTAVFASLAAWSVPQAFGTIWTVAYLSMVAVAFMGIRPLRNAWRADHGQAPMPEDAPVSDG